GTGGPHETDHLCVTIDNGFSGIKNVLVPADHYRQLPIFRTGLAAGNRRIEAPEPTFLCRLVQLSRQCRRSSRVVNVDGTRLHAGKGARRPEGHRTQIIIVTDTGEDEISAFRRSFRCWRKSAAVISGPFLGLRRCAIEYCELVTSTFRQVAGHRITHNTKTNERYFSHFSNVLS